MPTILEAWPEGSPRRASVNNFGYGGANGHVILEAFTSDDFQRARVKGFLQAKGNGLINELQLDEHYKRNGNQSSQESLASTELSSVPDELETIYKKDQRVFLLTSKDAGVTQAMMSNLTDYVERKERVDEVHFLNDLAHTLGARRSLFGWRVAVTASTGSELVTALKDPSTKPTYTREAPRLGFVFNGQGAQWFAMGRELFAYPVFRQAMEEADGIFRGLGASWSLIGMLRCIVTKH